MKLFNKLSIKYLSDKRLDTSDLRSQDRNRRLSISVVMSLISKIVQFGSQLAFVALAVRYLGAEKYGIWMTYTAVFGIAGLTSFGIGPGLVNSLASAHGREDIEEARVLFSTAFYMMAGISVLLASIFMFFFPYVDWQSLGNVPTRLAQEARLTVIVCGGLFLIQFPLSLVESTYTAYQESYISYIWQIVAQAASIVALIIAVSLKVDLPMLILSYSGTLTAVTLFNGIWMIAIHRRYLIPRISAVKLSAVKRLFRSASGFFLMTCAGLLVTQMITILIARHLGPAAVTPYSVTWRVVALINGMISMFTVPLWGAYGEARARLDLAWIWATHHKLVKGTLIYSSLAFGTLALIGPHLISLWAGAHAVPSRLLIVSMSFYGIAQAMNMANGALVSGFDRVMRQGMFAMLDACLAVSLAYAFIRFLGLGGVALGLLLATLVTSTLLLRYQTRQLHRQTQPVL